MKKEKNPERIKLVANFDQLSKDQKSYFMLHEIIRPYLAEKHEFGLDVEQFLIDYKDKIYEKFFPNEVQVDEVVKFKKVVSIIEETFSFLIQEKLLKPIPRKSNLWTVLKYNLKIIPKDITESVYEVPITKISDFANKFHRKTNFWLNILITIIIATIIGVGTCLIANQITKKNEKNPPIILIINPL